MNNINVRSGVALGLLDIVGSALEESFAWADEAEKILAEANATIRELERQLNELDQSWKMRYSKESQRRANELKATRNALNEANELLLDLGYDSVGIKLSDLEGK